VVCAPRHPLVTAAAAAAEGLQALPTNPQSAIEEPQVFLGIFPASHIHVRDHLADAEGRLAEVYQRLHDGLDPYSGFARDGPMETVREEEEPIEEISFKPTRKSIKLGPRPEQGNSLRTPVPVTQAVRPVSSVRAASPVQKPLPPRPSLKSGDDTAAGVVQPLVDEISSALREWHNLLFTYLSRRDYRLFNIVREHIEALHLGRRQLLAQTLSAEETLSLRRDCVARLVKGNVAQNLDVIVRHPAWGALVTVDVEGEIDMRSWVGAIPMYAMQVALAYVDAQPAELAAAYRASSFGDLTTSNRFNSPSTLFGSQEPLAPIDEPATTAKFFHIYLDVNAFVASPGSPGETAELYFSLYNKPEARFLTEEFCAVLNYNGVLARDPGDGKTLGRIRTLFTDLGQHDVQESIYLVCKIVRHGSMKLAGVGGVSGRRGSEPMLQTWSETGSVQNGNAGAGAGAPPTPGPSGAEGGVMYRRPFGCAVLELSQLNKMLMERIDSTAAKEHVLPIFVPVNEVTFSTLHQAIIASSTKEFEKSPK
jgi:dedicator of cytokinesis protein 3